MAPAAIVEPIDVAGQSLDGLGPRLEGGASDHLAHQRLEERLDHCVVIDGVFGAPRMAEASA